MVSVPTSGPLIHASHLLLARQSIQVGLLITQITRQSSVLPRLEWLSTAREYPRESLNTGSLLYRKTRFCPNNNSALIYPGDFRTKCYLVGWVFSDWLSIASGQSVTSRFGTQNNAMCRLPTTSQSRGPPQFRPGLLRSCHGLREAVTIIVIIEML